MSLTSHCRGMGCLCENGKTEWILGGPSYIDGSIVYVSGVFRQAGEAASRESGLTR